MIFKGYTKRDTSVLKGFAIACIVFHNFLHWLSPSPGENEFDFSSLRIQHFFQLLGERPAEFLNIVFSYLGHYGVQIFILVSGFGLALSMMRREKDWGSFMWDRFKKLYPLLLTGILVCFLGIVAMEKRSFNAYEWTEIGYKLLLIHTLIPNSGLSINGPWWFFAMILQLYMLFPLLYKGIRKWGWKTFLFACLFAYSLIFLFRYEWNEYHGTLLMMSALGHLPEFCLGILLAFSIDKKISSLWLVLALIVFALGNYFALAYPFTFLALSVLVVFAYQALKSLKFKKSWLSRPLAYLGGISMMLFAVHGSFRVPFLTWLNTQGDKTWMHLIGALSFFAFVWILALGAKPIYEAMCRLLNKVKIPQNRFTTLLTRIFQIAIAAFFALVMGYYIVQNVHRNNTEVTNYEVKVTEGVVTPNVEYVSLAKTTVDGRWLTLDVSCAVDIACLDTTKAMPYVVLEIGKDLWKRFEIPEDYRKATPQNFEVTYHYQCPFVKTMKGKLVKMYLWNPGKGSMRFDNAEVVIKH